MLDEQLPWYVAGPVLGACVLACRVLFNARLGVTGGFSELITRLSRRSLRLDWRGWFAIGIVLGGFLFVALGGSRISGYGWVTDAFDGSSRGLAAVVLVVAGVLIGFGAKSAGGCTSGNGLSGSSTLSPASLAATATFFATAIAVTFAVEAVI